MAEYDYQAMNKMGSRVEGTVEASDRRSAILMLSQQGYFVSSLDVSSGKGKGRSLEGVAKADICEKSSGGASRLAWPSFGRVKGRDVLAIVTQLGTALRAGLPLLNGLQIIEQQQRKPAVKGLLKDMSVGVSSGRSLSETMQDYPRVFGPLSQAMVRVGETGGILDQTMTELAEVLRRDHRIRSNVKNASAYPVFVLAIGLISVMIIVTWILPKLISTIAGGSIVLPWPTRFLLGFSSFMQGYGWLLVLVLLLLVWQGRRWTRSVSGRLWWDRFKLRVPVLGPVVRTIAMARFTRTLGALSGGGIPILEALHVVRDTLGNELLARQVDQAAEDVRMGMSLADALQPSGVFPSLLIQIVAIGEQTGKLDEMLNNAAETFEDDADAAISRFMAVLPGVLILLLALVIGFIVAATLLPIIVVELGAGGL